MYNRVTLRKPRIIKESTMNRLYLHLGTPKTGTTAIQFFMHNNKDLLLKLGYDYPDTVADFPDDMGYSKDQNNESAYANGNFILDALALTAYRQGPEAFESFLQYVFPDIAELYRKVIKDNTTDFDIFIQYLKDKLEKNNVIISSENLWPFHYDFLKQFIQELGDRLELIVYLRRQDQYVESMWNEVIKLSISTDTVEEYYDFLLFEEHDNHGLRYMRRLKKLCQIVGKEHLHIRLYESNALKRSGGIHQDFLRAVGINPSENEWTMLQRDVNERISGPAINIKRVFNEYLQQRIASGVDTPDQTQDHINKYNGIFYRLSSAYTRKQPEKDSYFSSSERIRMEKLFARDNAYIAEKLLGRAPGVPLFEDNDWTVGQNVKPLSANEETLLRMFFEVCYNEDIWKQKS